MILQKLKYSLVAVSFFTALSAQNVEFEKSNFSGKKEEFKDALRKLEVGIDFYSQGRTEFEEFKKSYIATAHYFPVSLHDYRRAGYTLFRSALAPLSDANRFNPKNAKLNFMLGFIWFNTEPTNKETIR